MRTDSIARNGDQCQFSAGCAAGLRAYPRAKRGWSVIRVRDLEEGIKIANSVRYGLTSTIFTRDVGKVFRFAERAQAGIIHVNRPGVGGFSLGERLRRPRSRRRSDELLH